MEPDLTTKIDEVNQLVGEMKTLKASALVEHETFVESLGLKGLDSTKIPSLVRMAEKIADLELGISNFRHAQGSAKAAEAHLEFDEETRRELKSAQGVLEDPREEQARRLAKLRDLVTATPEYKRALRRAIKGGGHGWQTVSGSDRDLLNFRRLPEGIAVPEDLKASPSLTGTGLSTDFGPGAGFLAPVNTEKQIEKLVVEQSPIVDLVDTRTIGGTAYEGLIRNLNYDPVQAVGERQTGTATTQLSRYIMKRIDINNTEVDTGLTRNMMEDSELDLVGEMTGDAGFSFARDEQRQILTGSGVEEAEGLFVSAEVLRMPSGTADGFDMDALRKLPFSLKADYRQGDIAQYLLSRQAIVRTLLFREDIGGPQTGQYLWQPSTRDGAPSRLNGFLWTEMVDMDAPGVNTYPVAFGNLKKAYRRVLRRGISLLRDELTQKPYILFFWSKRWGGRVWIGEAFVKMQCATS